MTCHRIAMGGTPGTRRVVDWREAHVGSEMVVHRLRLTVKVEVSQPVAMPSSPRRAPAATARAADVADKPAALRVAATRHIVAAHSLTDKCRPRHNGWCHHSERICICTVFTVFWRTGCGGTGGCTLCGRVTPCVAFFIGLRRRLPAGIANIRANARPNPCADCLRLRENKPRLPISHLFW